MPGSENSTAAGPRSEILTSLREKMSSAPVKILLWGGQQNKINFSQISTTGYAPKQNHKSQKKGWFNS